MRSEYDRVSHGSSARSVTSVTARVKLDSQQPMPPTTSGSCATRRCAAFLAFSAVSPVSYRTSFILAPPRALMPPLLFTSSMASSAPICSRMPWRAQGPESGTTRAIFTSRGFCARARRGASAAAVATSPVLMAVRRPINEGVVMRVVSIWLWVLRVGKPEVRAADPIVGEQGLVRPIEDDVTRLQHVAVVRALERFGHALLHEEDGQPVLAVNLGDALEDQIGHAGGEAHRRLVQHQEPWRAREPPADGQHLLFASRQRARQLAGALGEDGEQSVNALEGSDPLGAPGLRIRSHLEILAHAQCLEHLPSF